MDKLWTTGQRLWWNCDGKRLAAVVVRPHRPDSKSVFCYLRLPIGVWEQRSLNKDGLTLRDEPIVGEPKIGTPPA